MALPGLVAAQNLSDVASQEAAWNNLGRGVSATILSTNLVVRSEEFNLSPWATFGATIVADAAVAPNGTLTADKLIPDAGTSGLQRSVSLVLDKSTNAPAFVVSVFVKPDEFTRLNFRIEPSTPGTSLIAGCQFNLNEGTITGRFGNIFLQTITFEDGGWLRLSLGAVLGTESAIRWRITTGLGDEVPDGTSGVLLWGAQAEESSFLSVYKPTSGTVVSTQNDVTLEIKADDVLALRGVNRSSACDFVQIKGLTTLAQPRISAASINAQAATVFRDNALLKNSPVSEGDYYLSRGFLDGASLKVNNINLASISGSPFSGSTATSPLLFSSMGAPVNFRVSESMTLGTLSSPERAIPIETDDLILYAKAGQS